LFDNGLLTLPTFVFNRKRTLSQWPSNNYFQAAHATTAIIASQAPAQLMDKAVETGGSAHCRTINEAASLLACYDRTFGDHADPNASFA
jgi:hypothetical protein